MHQQKRLDRHFTFQEALGFKAGGSIRSPLLSYNHRCGDAGVSMVRLMEAALFGLLVWKANSEHLGLDSHKGSLLSPKCPLHMLRLVWQLRCSSTTWWSAAVLMKQHL